MIQPDRLTLRFPLNIDHAKTALVLSTDDERIRLSGIPPELGIDLIKAVNLGCPIADFLKERPGYETYVEALVSTLRHEGLLFNRIPICYSGKQMAELLLFYYEAWNQSLFSHSLWTSLAGGTARESVVDGWLIESYHFIRGANARLCYAASLTDDPRIRDIFSHHYIEEYDHYKFFAESLERRGLEMDRIEKIGPLPSTLAILNMARRAARVDCLAYAACSGLLESTGSDADRARGFYTEVARHYDKSGTGFVGPMLKHVDLDEEFQHGSVMEEVFGAIPHVLSERADRIIAVTAMFKETLALWFGDIEKFYYSKNVRTMRPGRLYRTNPPT